MTAIELLVNGGYVENINARNKQGETAVHYASRRGFNQIISFLAHHGALLDVCGKFGSVEDVAVQFDKVC